mmetsp:Transcript_1320/g.4148  ORF Transcript_1320/g.4148 Transcript_1320/m.4148 type:complete len:209 (-) Transcript_1320:1737-2363(-)
MYSCARVMGVGVGGGAVSAARGASMRVDKVTPAMTMMGRGHRRGARVAMGAKKAKRGGGNQDDYSSDFALYGSFDEDYGEGAGLLLGKQELRGGAGVGRGKKKAGYDAVAGVLDALANERKARRSSSPAPVSDGGVGYAKKSAYDVDDEETGAESNVDDFVWPIGYLTESPFKITVSNGCELREEREEALVLVGCAKATDGEGLAGFG